jgi:hypothetical protein
MKIPSYTTGSFQVQKDDSFFCCYWVIFCAPTIPLGEIHILSFSHSLLLPCPAKPLFPFFHYFYDTWCPLELFQPHLLTQCVHTIHLPKYRQHRSRDHNNQDPRALNFISDAAIGKFKMNAAGHLIIKHYS